MGNIEVDGYVFFKCDACGEVPDIDEDQSPDDVLNESKILDDPAPVDYLEFDGNEQYQLCEDCSTFVRFVIEVMLSRANPLM